MVVVEKQSSARLDGRVSGRARNTKMQGVVGGALTDQNPFGPLYRAMEFSVGALRCTASSVMANRLEIMETLTVLILFPFFKSRTLSHYLVHMVTPTGRHVSNRVSASRSLVIISIPDFGYILGSPSIVL